MSSFFRSKHGIFVLILLSAFWVSGCQKEEVSPHPKQKHGQPIQEEKTSPSSVTEQASIIPIEVKNGEFFCVSGWINDKTIVYITNTKEGSQLHRYNIFTGDQKLLFESPDPIASVHISPSGKQLLIYSSPTTYEGILSVIEANGKEVMNKRIPAFELEIEWNSYNEDHILVSAFSEDWEFSSYVLNIKEKKLTEIQLKEPFSQWLNKDHLLFLDWGEQNPSLFAPLVKMSISSLDEESVLKDIFYFKAEKDKIMTITVPAKNKEEATYTFLDNHFREFSSYSVPHLTRFSDWLVPYYDFAGTHQFITFKPLYSTAADTYSKGFQLIRFDIEKKEEQVLYEGLKNEPLNCSPNGNRCLYGYYYEKLLNFNSKEIVSLVKD